MRSGVLEPFQQPGSWNLKATTHSTAPLRETAAAVLLVTDDDSGLDLHRSFVTVPTVTAEVTAAVMTPDVAQPAPPLNALQSRVKVRQPMRLRD